MMAGRDRVLTMAQLAQMEREAALYATREQRMRRRIGRRKKNEDRWAEVRAWAANRGIGYDRACINVLQHGWMGQEFDLGNGLRAHVRRSGAGFYVAALAKGGARGRMPVALALRVLDALCSVEVPAAKTRKRTGGRRS